MSTELHEAFAVIDLGSNSFHLLLGRVFLPANTWHIEQQFSEAVQIRAGLSPQGELTWESMNRALACLDNFADKLVEFSPALHKVRVIGTATLRMAKNSTWFLRQATKILGYPIEVISGEEEAELIYHAFAQYLPRHMHEKILGIDVGGGSIELVVGEGRAPQASVSI